MASRSRGMGVTSSTGPSVECMVNRHLTSAGSPHRREPSWALSGAEPEAGRELAARLARWWIATGRYSEAGRFLTAAAEVPAAAEPGIRARVLLGAAWSAYNMNDNRRAATLAAEGIACARRACEPQLEIWGRNLLAGLAWYAGELARMAADQEGLALALSARSMPAIAGAGIQPRYPGRAG